MTSYRRAILDRELIDTYSRTNQLPDLAYCAIRDGILNGSIEPDTQLNQLQLARELNVSQRTVREALTRLTAQGLTVHEPYKGVRVACLSVEEITDVYRMRKVLEKWAMEAAAVRISSNDLRRMRQLLPMASGDSAVVRTKEVQRANREFHWIAIFASGRPQLVRVLEQLWELSLTYALREASPEEERRKASSDDLKEHSALLEALESQEGRRAGRIVALHIQGSFETLLSRWNKLRQRQRD